MGGGASITLTLNKIWLIQCLNCWELRSQSGSQRRKLNTKMNTLDLKRSGEMRWISLMITGVSLLLIALSVSCATSQALSLIPLQERTLLLSEEKPGHVFYTWRECAKRIIVCTRWEQKKEFYNLYDADTLKKLIHMGFVLKVRGSM